MILRRLRSRVALLTAIGLFFGGWTLTAMATTPVLESHMREFVYWTFGVGAFALLGAGGAFVSHLMTRMEKSVDASISRLEKTVETLGNDLIGHNASPFAHTAASEHNHTPMSYKIETLKEELDDHVLFCKTHQCAFGRRDPEDSPQPRRMNDPDGFDGRKLRGRQ